MGQRLLFTAFCLFGCLYSTSCKINFDSVNDLIAYTIIKQIHSLARNYQYTLLENSEISYQQYLNNIDKINYIELSHNQSWLLDSELLSIDSLGRIKIYVDAETLEPVQVDKTNINTQIKSNGIKFSITAVNVYSTIDINFKRVEIWIYLLHMEF